MSEKLDLDAIEAMCEAGQRPPEVSFGEHDGVEWAASWHNEAHAELLEQAPDLILSLVARVRELEARNTELSSSIELAVANLNSLAEQNDGLEWVARK